MSKGNRRRASRWVAGAWWPWPVIPIAPVSPSSLARTAASSDPPEPGDQLQLVQVADGVDLEEVEVVGPEPLEAVVDLRPRLVPVPQPGLGGQEDPVPDRGHPQAWPQLGVAVAGRDVEMVDPGVQGQLDRGVGGVLVDLGQGGRAVDQDRGSDGRGDPVCAAAWRSLHAEVRCPLEPARAGEEEVGAERGLHRVGEALGAARVEAVLHQRSRTRTEPLCGRSGVRSGRRAGRGTGSAARTSPSAVWPAG